MAFGYFNGNTPADTPESSKRKRAVAEALMRGVVSDTPKNIGEGISAIAKAVMVRSLMSQAEAGESAGRASADSAFNAAIGSMGGNPGVDTFTTSATGAGSTVGGSPAADMSGNQIFSGFMGALKSGGLTNPNALAALASTGQHESGFSPGNVYRSWNDPSESGEAGTSGGLLSWRGPRFAAMRSFAAQNGGDATKPSPELQARFFLQENPQLTSALNNAGSPEEAQRLMNAAWRFAGWDRPGGEAGRRISTARSFAGQFGGPQASAEPVSGITSPASVAQIAGAL